MAPDTSSSGIITSMQSPAARRLLHAPRVVSSWFHWATGRLERHPGALYVLCSVAVLTIILLIASSPVLPAGILPLLGICLLVSLLLGSLCLYIWTLQPKSMRQPKSLFLLASVILLTVAITRSFFFFLPSAHQALPHVPASALEYSIPVALGGLLLALLFNSRLAFAGALAISILTSLVAADGFRFFLYSLVSSLAAIFALVGQKDRATLLKAGAAVGLANLYSILAWSLLSGTTEWLGFHLLCGLAGGLFVAILSLGLLPLFEYLFEVATDFRLLELCNLNHPLLKEMILKAPGTYHHSVVVGTLAEAAAEAIGANALLCRVGAYYHDIGKITKPSYFVENQQNVRSRHEKLGPSLSSLVIVSHVKGGIELGRAYGLPQTVLEMIPQHHGTRLILFFYHKAKGTEESDQGEVQEEKFRYPGPKPQTKEAAILMLADAVEAASRTLTERTPGRFQALVAKIVNAIFADGQLRECELTFSELRLIEENFIRILSGIYHRRVEYPGFAFEESAGRRGANGTAGHKSTKEDQARHEISKKGRADYPRHSRGS
ncbi:HDIG domain-containing metalloprotein [Candidatus Methylomirabilis sp.]|uniref:HD family phosphohydrolase n=1 Tax=Candidatus Methylomirabilis sp. TaxID=2032687 RepID=UPI002A5DA3A4|nr:HDIG domain-containing protein [Candidatus Methylomirabilis sp.]